MFWDPPIYGKILDTAFMMFLNLCPPNCHSQVSPPRFESAVDDAGIFPALLERVWFLTQPSICKWCYWRSLDDFGISFHNRVGNQQSNDELRFF